MEVREGYIKTKLGWIPEDWGLIDLEKISDFITKGATPTTYGFDWQKEGILFLKSECVSQNGLDLKPARFISNDADEHMVRSQIKADDILITITGNVGRVVILSKDFPGGNINQHIARIRINNGNMYNGYVYQYLNQDKCRRHYYKITTGQAYPQISLKQVRETLVPRPPLPEQQKIAEILTTVDDKISSIEDRIQQTEQLKKGLMEKLLTEGIGHTEFKDTKVGRIPVGWDLVGCERLCEKITDGEHLTPTFIESGIPLVSAKDVEETGVNFANVKFVSNADYIKMAKRCNPQKDDVLIVSRGATIGRATLNSTAEKFALMGSVILLKPNRNVITGMYLSQYIKNPSTIKSLLNLSGSSAQQAIYLKDIKKLLLPCPSLPEQKQIASILSTVDEKLDVLHTKKANYETLKKGLMEQLLTGKMRVKV